MDQIRGPNQTEVDRIDQIETMWTEQDQIGLNTTKQTKYGRIKPSGPNKTKMDQIGPELIEVY